MYKQRASSFTPRPTAEARRFVGYSFAGAVATSVHYVVLIASVELLHGPVWQGVLAGALAGAIVGYGLNHRFTFRSMQLHRVALPRFAAVALAGALLQILLVDVGTELLGWHYLAAQLFATATALAMTFVVNRQWTF